MQSQPQHPLESLIHKAVSNSFKYRLGVNDPEVIRYVGRMLCEFTDASKLYPVRDEHGHPITDLTILVDASDPVHGTAPSFDAERAIRKFIGDYALFITGMFPESTTSARSIRYLQSSRDDLIDAGQKSYYIVSQFNVFEYEGEAPLFSRLSEKFERCIYGINLARAELGL